MPVEIKRTAFSPECLDISKLIDHKDFLATFRKYVDDKKEGALRYCTQEFHWRIITEGRIGTAYFFILNDDETLDEHISRLVSGERRSAQQLNQVALKVIRMKHLLSRIRSSEIREYLEEFNLLHVNYSDEAKKLIRIAGEDQFFGEIDLWDFENEFGGSISVRDKEFYFAIVSIHDDEAYELVHIVHISTMSEELTKREEFDGIAELLADIEVE